MKTMRVILQSIISMSPFEQCVAYSRFKLLVKMSTRFNLEFMVQKDIYKIREIRSGTQFHQGNYQEAIESEYMTGK